MFLSPLTGPAPPCPCARRAGEGFQAGYLVPLPEAEAEPGAAALLRGGADAGPLPQAGAGGAAAVGDRALGDGGAPAAGAASGAQPAAPSAGEREANHAAERGSTGAAPSSSARASQAPACAGVASASAAGERRREWWPRWTWDAPARPQPEAAPLPSAAAVAVAAAAAASAASAGAGAEGSVARGKDLMVFDVRYPNKRVRLLGAARTRPSRSHFRQVLAAPDQPSSVLTRFPAPRAVQAHRPRPRRLPRGRLKVKSRRASRARAEGRSARVHMHAPALSL